MRNSWQQRLFRFLQEQENESLLDRGEPVRHRSPEGGLDTVGYGHKLTMGENISGTVYGIAINELTPGDCAVILAKDVEVCYAICELNIPRWQELTDRERAMVAEIEFNVGKVHQRFPKFVRGCVEHDIDVQRAEFKRHYHDIDGVRHELARRNKAFYDTFLADEVIDGSA